MDDVDVAEAALIAHNACFENGGQCCWYVKCDIFPLFRPIYKSFNSTHLQ